MGSQFRFAANFIGMFVLVLALAGCGLPQSPRETQGEERTAGEPAQEDSDVAVSDEKINLNDMTRQELLETIPDFSNRMVREFFEYQPYISIQQFRREMGKYVSAETIAGYEDYVYVPVDVDESDSETLQQIPGLDASIADALMAARPFNSNGKFLETLAGHVSPEQLEQAAFYLSE